ncbi:MAG: MFS transporter [Oligoflexia bacterium]|nr:MAG: MFS transporter [Oligoflexia bacterium]
MSATLDKKNTWFGHPKGLFILFFAEMWERMSYYGMRALLVLYMTKYLLTDPERAARITGYNTFKSLLEMGFGPLDIQPFSSQLYGLYTGFVFLSPFFGGILADKVWGRRRSVYVGGFLMAIGHFLMAFESQFLFALFFLILGNGAFKPNISTQVGSLYPEGDPRRDGAFTIFYMGINLGAFFSPFLADNLANWLCGVLGRTEPGAAWHMGFTFAGIGMLIGMLVYHFGRHQLPKETDVHLAPPKDRNKIAVKTTLGLLGSMAGFLLLLMLPGIYKAIIIGLILYFVVFSIRKISDQLDRSKVTALVVLCLGTIAFWAIFEQQGNTLQLWADEKADWETLGLRSTNYQAFNPFMIFVFAPILTGLWESRARKGKAKSSSVRKMAIGSFLAGAAFLVLSLATQSITAEKSLSNLFWLTLTTWIFTMGELYLSPIGLSLVTKVSPNRFLSMMMGMWFLSSFIGNYLSGYLGSFYSSMSNQSFFMLFAVLGGVVGLFFLFSEPRLQKIIGKDV